MTKREIKFRAWDKKEKRMRFFDLKKNLYFWNDETKSGYEPMGEFPIMQYTGLIKDRHGKEIWEGDIVKVKSRMFAFCDENFEVINKGYGFYFKKEREHFFGQYLDSCEFEVIGNVFENPDLLK